MLNRNNKLKATQYAPSYKAIANFSLIFIICILVGCKKLNEIPPPVSTITTSQVFSSDEQAKSVVAGIYFQMINTTGINFSSGAATMYLGAYADELKFFNLESDDFLQIQNSSLLPTNTIPGGNFWTPCYSYIYAANAVLGNIDASGNIHDSVKNQLKGEAKFIRAFCFFYLANLFENIPLPLTVDYNKTALLSPSSLSQIYQQITQDLIDAQTLLSSDYRSGNDQRIIPNKYAATALLSRVYLYNKNWEQAESEASKTIEATALYHLENDLNNVFSPQSNEAIWQLQQNNTLYPYNATPEGFQIIPLDTLTQPYVYLTEQLLDSFEMNDKRRAAWVGHTNYNNTDYYFPYKYKTGPALASFGGAYSEYYTVLRLAEQFLIRAEARAMLNKLDASLADLNTIRNRSGLPNITSSNQSEILNAILHERQTEMFCEWGHRWLDLKRLNLAASELKPQKPLWSEKALLLPIPIYELQADPNLRQNTGY